MKPIIFLRLSIFHRFSRFRFSRLLPITPRFVAVRHCDKGNDNDGVGLSRRSAVPRGTCAAGPYPLGVLYQLITEQAGIEMGMQNGVTLREIALIDGNFYCGEEERVSQ